MSVLAIWFVIWILVGVVVGALASVVSSKEPPYGLVVDIGAAVLTMVVFGLFDYHVLRRAEVGGIVAFAITVLEPLTSATLLLWLLRVIKHRRGG